MTDPAVQEPPSPAAAPPAAATGPLADLILARLLPAKDGVPPKKVRDDLAVFFRRPPSAERVGQSLAALRAAGLVTPKGQQLTDAGRVRGLAYLGMAELPPKADWRTVKAKYLVPMALGLSPTSATDAKRIATADKLAALLLKRKFDLPVGTPDTPGGVFEALACRLLGFPDHTTLKAIIPGIISQKRGYDPPLTNEQLKTVGPRLLLDAPKPGLEGLRAALLAGLADEALTDDTPPAAETRDTTPAERDEPFDLEAFANTVRSAARTCPTGRFGDNKVFIGHVWRLLRDEPRFAPLGPDGFKAKLVEANRANLLTLSRADLVQLMDPADVRESETTYLNAVYHFVLVGGQ